MEPGRPISRCPADDGLYAEPIAEVWDVPAARPVLSLPPTRWPAFCFHPQLPRILGAAENDSVAIWDLENGEVLKQFPIGGPAQLLAFSPDGEEFAAERQVGTRWVTSMFNVDSGAESKTVVGPRFNFIAWGPRDRWIALIVNNEVHLNDPKSGETRLLGRHKGEARSAVFSPDGGYLFTAGDEQEIICWDLRSMERAFSIGLQSAQLQFGADGAQCAVTTSTGVLLHSFERPMPYQELTGDLGGGVGHGVISPNGRWLAAGGRGRLGLWDLTEESPAGVLIEARNSRPFFSPDSSELFAFWDEGFGRWRITPEVDAVPKLTPLSLYKPARIRSAGFAGETLLLGLSEGAMTVPSANIPTGPGKLWEVGFAEAQLSPDGKWVAFCKASQHFVDVYSLNPWNPFKFVKCDAYVLADAFTPKSDELAIATYASVTFVDSVAWNERRRFPVSLDRNAQIIFSPKGDSFWLVHNARSAALHDTKTFETLLPLPAGTIPLAVSLDGQHLAVSVDTRRVQVWDLALATLNLRELRLDWEK